MIADEWFVVSKHAEEKCAGRCEVLQKTEGGKAQMLRSVPEPTCGKAVTMPVLTNKIDSEISADPNINCPFVFRKMR